MEDLLKNSVLNKYQNPVNSAKDCDNLSIEISIHTRRNISSTTLRRFFGLLPSKSNLSKYNLDTLSIYCGYDDYKIFGQENISPHDKQSTDTLGLKNALKELADYTLNSIAKKTLGGMDKTITREELNKGLKRFLQSKLSIVPLVAPGGYGKSIALAHWVRTLVENEKDVLFCSANIFSQLISPNGQSNNSLNLDLDSDENIFETYLRNGEQIIIVVDSVDELSSTKNKSDDFFNYLIKFLGKYSQSLDIKIVFSSRTYYWNKIIKPDLINLLKDKKLDHLIYDNQSDSASFLEFSLSEIKKLISLNSDSFHHFQYHTIPFILQDLIRVPINLYFLFELFKKDIHLSVVSANSLNRKYLKEFVFDSKYAEYKEDIIWKVIELIYKQNDSYSFNKNLLKKSIPVHLKRETEYYNAYKSLITSGILYEERIENKYGIFVTIVGFKHHNFFFYVSALNLIDNNGGLDYSLFEEVANSYRSLEWKYYLTSILFEIAYENEDYEALKDFCKLPEDILSSLMVRFSVTNLFRIDNSIRSRLVSRFAEDTVGQTYFFEHSVDINFIVDNYELRMSEFLQNKNTTESRLFGNSILYLAGFLKMDIEQCNSHYEIFSEIEPDSNIHPWPIGRKVAYQILNKYFIENQKIDDIYAYVEHYLNIAYSYPNYLNYGLVEFELSIFISLILTKEYNAILTLYDKLIKSYKIKVPEELSYTNKYNQNILPYLYSEYAKYKLGLDITDEFVSTLEKTVDSFPSGFDDFQYKIILNYILTDYFKDKDMEKSKDYHLSALRLSEFAQYNFYIAFLLLNNPSGDNEEMRRAKNMVSNYGFELECFKH